MKRTLAVLICMALLFPAAMAEAEEIHIQLGNDAILVDNALISEDTSQPVYLTHRVEVHEDVPEELADLSNRIITIADAGTYRFSGSASDAQIAVKAGEDDAVRLILDGAEITCRTAPGIAVHSAADSRVAGEYGVTIELAGGSMNSVAGSHTEEVEEDDIKLSGAITSLVSIGFEGDGYLNVNGDNEGIETKFGHMTFNGGNITVESGDDPVNASEDDVSVITINDGVLNLQVKPDKGGEGDGMDSNGSIIINGGTVVSYSHPESMDSGVDSDLGCIINGGVVMSAGNMYDEISAESGQLFMALQFAQKANEMIVVTDTNGVPVMSANLADGDSGYTSFVLSSPVLAEGDYHLYLGGELTEENGEMVYAPGKQLQHGGAFGEGFGRGSMPGTFEGKERPEGMPEMPEGFEPPEKMGFPKAMQPPQAGGFNPGRMRGSKGFGGSAEAAEASTVFHLVPGGNMFNGIKTAE